MWRTVPALATERQSQLETNLASDFFAEFE